MVKFIYVEAFDLEEFAEFIVFMIKREKVTNFEIISGSFLKLIFQKVVVETTTSKFLDNNCFDTFR